MRFVDVEEARDARGLRLVVVTGVPSPWSEAAKGLFDAKDVDYCAVRLKPANDDAVRTWTRCHNGPVAMFDDEPPRSHWTDILALAERLASSPSLLPSATSERATHLGLVQELLGEGGLIWCHRLLVIHAGITTDGQRGFPARLGRYLAPKYGYAPERVAHAKRRVLELLQFFGDRFGSESSRGSPYLVGDRLSALDIYLATALGAFAPLPPEACPMLPAMRQALETADDDVRSAVPHTLLAHRDFIYGKHLKLPVEL
jgi:glutathione S-transferase